jgi:preprotein translocase subunit SecB
MSEANAAEQQPHFNIEKVYIKDLSVEVPHAPEIFLEREAPSIDLKLNNEHAQVADEVFEATVTAVVTAKVKDKVVFLIEAKQAGVFRLRNIVDAERESVLEVLCPNILFPYLREIVSESAVRAGFLPVLLNPVDFGVLYAQQKQQAAATAH